MKITSDDIIKTGEQDLIDAINGDLDWEVMEAIFREKHKLDIGEDVEFKKGDIVIHENRIAYQLEFDVKVGLSILVDRQGGYLGLNALDGQTEKEDND